ncbi:antitoxin Xre/MbcA/ParS toxin-binding domain-containing protein [Stenotrophomonas maltophilia]
MGAALPEIGVVTTPVTRNERQLAKPAMQAFRQVAGAWHLTDSEQSLILGLPVESVHAALQTGNMDELWPAMLERVSYVLGIYRALHTLFPNRHQADGWIRRPNQAPLFGGSNALSLMCSGQVERLAAVRQYLEAQGMADP